MFAINLIEVFVLQEIKTGNQQEGLWTLACSLAARPAMSSPRLGNDVGDLWGEEQAIRLGWHLTNAA